MKKRIVKILSFFFSALFVISFLPMSISAGYTIESTDVFSDLEAMEGFDLSEYPKNEKSDFCSVIAFHEYGYDYNRRKNDYGLYVYVYNPSADPIFNSKDNKIGFDRFGDGSVTKYNLILLSSSVKEGYEHVFYKFKVDVDDDFYRRLSPSCRRYAVSGIELKRDGDIIPVEYAVSSVYEYTGFDSYHGPDPVSNVSDLRCNSRTLETVSLELHGASWKTATSDKGKNHQYEVSSVYFAIPNYFLEKYGSEEDLYNGLYALTAEWYEYKINGLVTNHNTLYSQAKALEGKYIGIGSSDAPFTFKVRYPSKGDRAAYNHYYWGRYEGYTSIGYQDDVDYIMKNYEHITSLCNVISYYGADFKEISTAQLKNEIYDDDGNFDYLPFVDEGRALGYNRLEFTTDDAPLNLQISSYATNHSGFWTWFEGDYSDLWVDADGYPEIKVFEKINSDDFDLADDQAAAALFLSVSDYRALESFYNKAADDDCTVYLMRFAVTDYVFAEAWVQKADGDPWIDYVYSGKDTYYFEKTIFHNFDVLDLTFEDEYHGKVKLPVVASPITIVGTITPGPVVGGSSGGSQNGSGVSDSSGCASMGLLDTLTLALGAIALAAIVVIAIRIISWILKLLPKKKSRGSETTVAVNIDSGQREAEAKRQRRELQRQKKGMRRIYEKADKQQRKELRKNKAEWRKIRKKVDKQTGEVKD